MTQTGKTSKAPKKKPAVQKPKVEIIEAEPVEIQIEPVKSPATIDVHLQVDLFAIGAAFMQAWFSPPQKP